jgi:Flp pilus assembly protein TadD
MKKSLVFLLGCLFMTAYAEAQGEGANLAKAAGKALATYNMDRVNNAGKLEEAKTIIKQALQYPEAQAMASAWIYKGDIYLTILQNDLAKRFVNPAEPLTGDNDALEAFNAYQKGYELATKAYEKSDALKGITIAQSSLINIGVAKYEAQEFGKAFLSFQAALQSHELLKSNAQKSYLDDQQQYNDIMYFTSLAARMANRNDDALRYFEIMYKAGTDKPEVYEGIYNIKSEMGDEAGAGKILAEGRQKFPDNPGLLFAEINDYVKKGKLEELTGRLQQAIAQEPGNIGLYVTLGNVYDNLYQREMQAQNLVKADEYFKAAKKYYSDAVNKDPKNVDAAYSLGSLYYNKAAIRTQELNALPEDFSREGIQHYENMRNEIMALFDEALPYFQKAESLKPNDMNTLIALTEIYARKEDIELYTEFKKRLETVRGGGENAESYFGR